MATIVLTSPIPRLAPTAILHFPMDKYRGAVVEVPVDFRELTLKELNEPLYRTYNYHPPSRFHRTNRYLARSSLHMTVTSLTSRNLLCHVSMN